MFAKSSIIVVLVLIGSAVAKADDNCIIGADALTKTVEARDLGFPIPQADSVGPWAEFVLDFEKGLERITDGNVGAIRAVLQNIYPEEIAFDSPQKQNLARSLYEFNKLDELILHQDMTADQSKKISRQLGDGVPVADVIRSIKPPIDETLQDAINHAYSSDRTAAEIRRRWFQSCMVK